MVGWGQSRPVLTPPSLQCFREGPSFTRVTWLWSCVGASKTRFHSHKLSLAHTDPSLVGTGFPAHVE